MDSTTMERPVRPLTTGRSSESGRLVRMEKTASATLPRLDSLTGLRFFAAFLVVQHHFTNFAQIPGLREYTGFGATGVSFFFVLSGFVLTWSFIPSDTPPRFYWRRFARIWPLHVVTTLLALPVFYAWRELPMNPWEVVLSIFLLHAWAPTATTYFAGNPASWTLSCEMFFYALHPLFIRRVMRWSVPVLLGAMALIFVALAVVADFALDWPARLTGWLLYIAPVYRVGEFFIGVGLAAAMKRGFRVPIGVIPAALLVGVWFWVYYRFSPLHLGADARIVIADFSYVALPLFYGLVIAAAAQLDLRGAPSVLRSRGMVWLGQWSYALYLVHATIIYALIEWIGPRERVVWTNLWWLGAVSVVCVAASAALYYVIEHPIEQWLRNLQRRHIAARQRTPRAVPAKG